MILLGIQDLPEWKKDYNVYPAPASLAPLVPTLEPR